MTIQVGFRCHRKRALRRHCSVDAWARTDPLARRAHGERRRGHVHVKGLGQFQGLELLELLLQSPVLVGQRLTALFEELTVHFGLLELRPDEETKNTLMNIHITLKRTPP